MIQQATKLEWKVLLENKSKFLLVHSSSGHKHALKEILSDSSIASRLADTKASSEVKALDTFYSTLQNEPDKAYYG
ncbi:protein pelota homolog [Exaiptasia diaphana]|nr:protein pelota homolog [Exaiptasia diaphana]